jgi:hypothetical protein
MALKFIYLIDDIVVSDNIREDSMKNIPSGDRGWPALIAEWKRSGLNMKEFSDKKGIPNSSFHTAFYSGKYAGGGQLAKPHKKRKRAVGANKVPKDFVKVAIEKPSTRDPCLQNCVIEGPNGVRIELNQVDPSFLLQLLSLPGGP